MIGNNNNLMSLLPLLMGMGKGNNQQGMNIADIISNMQGGQTGMQGGGFAGGTDNGMASMLNLVNMMNAGKSRQSSPNTNRAPSFDTIKNMLPSDMVEVFAALLKNNANRG